MGIRQGVVSLAKPTASRTLWPPGHSTDSLTEARERDMCFVNHRGSLYPGLCFQAPSGQTRFLLKAQWSRTQALRLPVSHSYLLVGARASDIHDELPLSETLQSSPLSDPAPGFSFEQILFNFHHPGFFSPHRFIFYLQDTYFFLPCRKSAFRMDSAQHPSVLPPRRPRPSRVRPTALPHSSVTPLPCSAVTASCPHK